MTTVLKVGGSVITDKNSYETVDHDSLQRVAAALQDADDLILVHGAGSFGHPHASEAGIDQQSGTNDSDVIEEIRDAVLRLKDHVIDSLRDNGVDCTALSPFSIFRRDERLHGDVHGIELLLDGGTTPVLHGDLVPTTGTGATVLSGDEIVAYLAPMFEARAGFCCSVDGVLDDEGNVIDRIDSSLHGEQSNGTDVTGGMQGKIETLLSYGCRARIFGLGDLAPFLDGEDVGTLVDA